MDSDTENLTTSSNPEHSKGKTIIQKDPSSSGDDDQRKLVFSKSNSRKFIIVPAKSPILTSKAIETPSSTTTASTSHSTTYPTTSIGHQSQKSESDLHQHSKSNANRNTLNNGSGYGLIKQSDTIYQIESYMTPSSPQSTITKGCNLTITPSSNQQISIRPIHYNSLRSVRSAQSAHYDNDALTPGGTLSSPNAAQIMRTNSYNFTDSPQINRIFTEATSVRSLASIGVGSTDGKKLVIRKVPNSPIELLSLVNPPSVQTQLDNDDDESFCDISEDSETAQLKPRRQYWANKMQFVLACIGYSVGLGNVWRFPYLCYKSGGGVFLVPYLIILIVCGVPMLFMELAVGQYTGRGPIGAFGQICPLFKGAGLAGVVVSFLMSTYYSVIIAYAIYYFFTSFKPIMPWTDCNNRWNTDDCWVPERLEKNMTRSQYSRTPSEEFFENKVLQISGGIEDPGGMRWELVACLICAWMLVYFAIWKSIKSSAKVRYLTATFPFVLIVVFMCRALTLEGAENGLRFFFRPKWELLKHANVWINAAAQNFNSLGIAFGSMISFASYNKYNNNILHDTLAVSLVNAVTSILVGVFAFATLGNLALEQGTQIESVISDGPGLIFIVYPQAMAKMPAGQMWAVLFFFMLLCLGLNSQFAIVEVVVTSLQDGFPRWIKNKLVYHELLVLIVCVISFMFGLPNLIRGGIFFFQLIDHYAASVSIMFLAFFQVVAIGWFYGNGRLSKNVKQMTERAPSLYFRSCWVFCGPTLLICLWIFSLINYHPPHYHNGKYSYPGWAHGIGWGIAGSSLICIPGYAIVNIVRANGKTFMEKLKNAIKPNIYECKICGEHHCEHDFPEEDFVLAHEISPIVKPTIILKTPPPSHINRNAPPFSTQLHASSNEKSNSNTFQDS